MAWQRLRPQVFPGRRVAAVATMVVAVFLGTPSVLASEPLTLRRAVALALEQEPGVRAARARQAGIEAEARLAESGRKPTLSLLANTSHHQEPMLVTPIHGFSADLAPEFDETLVQAGLTAGYDLYQGGARNARIDRSRRLAEAAEASVEEGEEMLVFGTAAAYLEILGLAEVEEAHRARLAALSEERRRVEQLIAVGRAAELERHRIEAAVAAAEAERVRLTAALEVAERQLARFVGLGVEETRTERLSKVELASPEPLPRKESLARALAANPEIARSQAELRAGEAALALAESGRRPRLRVEGSWLHYGSTQGDFDAEWRVGLGVGLPLFDGGATRERIAGTEAARVAAAEELRRAEQTVEQDLDRALARAEESRAQVESLETAVRRFAEVSRIERLRLDTGVGTQTDFLAAEAELLQARAGLVRARLGVITARLEVARATGDLTHDWIAAQLEEQP